MITEGQLNSLIGEFSETRKSFDRATAQFGEAVHQIKWNRRNTKIQYVLIILMVIAYISGVLFYVQDQHDYREDQTEACERGNEVREQIAVSLDAHAVAIGVALTAVSDAPQEKFDQYLEVYRQQPRPEALELREC